MRDSDVIKIARRIDVLNYRISQLVWQIEGSDHPNAGKIVWSLRDNNFDNAAWATHCVSHALEHPEQWETGYWGSGPQDGIRRKKNVKKD